MHTTDIAFIFPLTVLLVSLPVQAYALYHLFYRNRNIDNTSKRIWALIVVLGSILGALAYLIVAKSNE